MEYRYISSPIGDLLLAGSNDILQIIGFPEGKGVIAPGRDWQEGTKIFSEVEDQLGEYFCGRRQKFDFKMKASGTPFQLSVLEALLKIPFGHTTTYHQIAIRIGRPKAMRAVGAANGRNPLPIVIPCHRVIGADGSLTGFGGGLDAKAFLLNLESAETQGVANTMSMG